MQFFAAAAIDASASFDFGITTAGAFAATLVTPQDAIKTRMQLAAHRNLAFSTAAREAVATGGPTALFAGLSARLLRIPLYSAVTLSTFETMKRAFERA